MVSQKSQSVEGRSRVQDVSLTKRHLYVVCLIACQIVHLQFIENGVWHYQVRDGTCQDSHLYRKAYLENFHSEHSQNLDLK